MELDELETAFNYLDALRGSGVTNMLGAGPYIESRFDYDKKLSRKILNAWVFSYDGETSAFKRAKAHISEFE